MAITVTYDSINAKVVIAGLTAGTTYQILRGTGINLDTLESNYSLSTYSDYFITAGRDLLGATYKVIENATNNIKFGPTVINTSAGFDNSFLIGSGSSKYQQISILYDENISSFKQVRKDFVQETIGGKFPFVIRNANVNYRTMEFSGIVTSVMDPENFSGYGSSYITNNYNTMYTNERLYRDWLVNWLNDGTPKVLKTANEGLFLVRLTNLNLTPNREVGRIIYSFSCSFTEIADVSIDNLVKYKFLTG